MSEYTPTTEQVESGYAHEPEYEYHNPVGYGSYVQEMRRAFRRWLAEEKAKAWTEGRESVAKDLMTPADETGVKKVSGNPYRRGGSDE